MKIVRTFSELPRFSQPTAVAIGNFDGVHLGHKKIISFLVQRARASGRTSLVLTFSPHPGKKTGAGKIRLLQTETQKLERLSDLGVEMAFLVPFDRQFALLSSRTFYEKIVLSELRAGEIVVGGDFRFGKNREGSIRTLQELAADGPVKIHAIASVRVDGEVVSSSLIRRLLLAGDIIKANRFLGEPYEIRGEVVKGKAIGKGLGFPTANLKSSNEILPAGVFITLVGDGQKDYPSVTNIGTRPTFGHSSLQIETHALDVDIDFYGKQLQVRFLKKLRDEIHFDSAEALAAQIKSDIHTTRRFFESRP